MSKECILSILKKTERSETTLRYSAVQYSIFCGSLFKLDPATEAKDLAQMHTLIFEVSYKYLASTFPATRHLTPQFSDNVLSDKAA